MARPTEIEFEEYLAALPALSGIGQVVRASDMVLREPYQSGVQQFLHDVIEQRVKLFDEISEYAVPKWIVAQPTGDRAYQALFGKKSKSDFSVEVYARDLVLRANRLRTVEGFKKETWLDLRSHTEEEIAERVAHQNSTDAIQQRIRSYCSYFANWNPWSVETGVASAFRDYFYADRYKRLAADGKDSLEFAQRLLSTIAALRSAEGANLFVPIEIGTMAKKFFDKTEQQLNEFIHRFDSQALPIRRVDATARERALAFDLWRSFYGAFRSSKPKAIAYMMEFDGVSQPIDFRTLERMASDWKAGVPLIRHLILR